MPVNVVITDRKVYNQYGNGNNFTLNPTEFATYLRGGVMNVQQANYTIEIDWYSQATETNGVDFRVDGNQMTRNIGSWIEEGFSIGDTIDFAGTLPVGSFIDRTITNITETLIVFDGAAEAVVTYDAAILLGGKTDLFALEYSFGIIPNNAEDDYTSLLDNTDQTYYAEGIGEDTGGGRIVTFVNMEPKTNSVQSWVTSRTGATDVRYVDRPSTYVQRFEIRHEYIINPYIDNALYTGNKSLKYISKFDFRTNLPNLNTSKIAEDDIQLGSVGYFDENYDGYNNDFTIIDLVYTDVATVSTVTELNIKSKTKVEFTVNSISGLFNDFDPFVVFHSYIPEFNVYNKNANNFRDVWKFDSVKHGLTAGAANGSIIKNVIGAYVNDNEISIEFEIEFTSGQQQTLEEGFIYKIAIEVGDGDTDIQPSNVTLLIDDNTYEKDANITGLIISDSFGFNPYNLFISPIIDLFSTYKGWIEDEIVSYHRFGVNRTVAKDAEIIAARFKIVAYEDATGETFDLQNEELDLSGQLIAPIGTVSGNPFPIQLIDDDRTRGYNLPLGDEFNLLLFETDTSDATYQYYEWRVGFKMNWQTWVALPNADNIFIIVGEPFNNKNNRASNYSLKNGWSIRGQWQFDMQGINDESVVGETEYNFYSSPFEIVDFDEQDDDPTHWICEIKTFDSLGNDLGGLVLTDEYTDVKAIFTPSAPYIIADIADWWGEQRIAEQNQPGFDNDVLTTTKPFISNNRLIPLVGETQLKKTLVANTIELDGRVDFNRLVEGLSYKLSAELRGDTSPPVLESWTFTTENLLPTDAPFDPSVATAGGEVPTWTLIEGYNQVAAMFTKSDRTSLGVTELDGSCQNVVVTFSTNDPSNILEINVANDQICQTLDLSMFDSLTEIRAHINTNMTGFTQPDAVTSILIYLDLNTTGIIGVLDLSNIDRLQSTLIFNDCPALTGITFASSIIAGGNINIFRAQNSNLTGNLDLSKLTKLGGEIRINDNLNLTGVTFPPTIDSGASNISILTIKDSNLTGGLDLSMFPKIGGQVILKGNSNMTSVTFTSTLDVGAANLTLLRIFGCNLTGTLDLSNLTNLSTTIEINANSNLTDVSMPTTTNVLGEFSAQDCALGHIDLTGFGTSDGVNVNMTNNNMTAAEVNEMLVDLDNTGWVGLGTGTLSFAGTNAAPDGSSGGFDGDAAKASLIIKNFNVTTN